jgi:hypothetical protein
MTSHIAVSLFSGAGAIQRRPTVVVPISIEPNEAADLRRLKLIQAVKASPGCQRNAPSELRVGSHQNVAGIATSNGFKQTDLPARQAGSVLNQDMAMLKGVDLDFPGYVFPVHAGSNGLRHMWA